MTTTAAVNDRAFEEDVAVREGNLRACIAFMLIRHGALQTASKDNPHKELYRQARDSAEREILWRFAQIEAKVADLECQPLVLITQRMAYAKALVDAQLCDTAEAERRALRTYPSPGGMVP
jgi:hypothetical protein